QATPTSAARQPIAPPRAARDLSAALPVPTLVPTATPLPVTPAVRPATLTPTPVPPTPVPSPTPGVALAPTAAGPPLAPREPTPPAADEREASVLDPAAAAPRSAARDTITAPSAALPREPVGPAPARSYVVGLPDEPGRAGWLDPDLLWLGVPSRTQFDGTPYAAANCGPSALGMILEAYGLRMSTAELRNYANYLQGTYGYDDGIALDHLAEIGRRANLKPIGLYGRNGYRRWSVEDVRATVLSGYPVIVLTKYRLLPGNEYYSGNVNHYVVISGLLGDDFLYNDSAFGGGGGRGLVISASRLEDAWATADIPRHAVAFALGEAGYGLLPEDATQFGRGAGRVPATGIPSLADQQAVTLDRLVPGSATAAAAEARRVQAAAERRPPDPAAGPPRPPLDTPSPGP